MGRLELLKENLDKTDKELADLLQAKTGIETSYAMVVAMRKANGLSKKAEFSEEDNEWLKDNYNTADWQTIYDRFPTFSKAVIKQRAYSLKVYREVKG